MKRVQLRSYCILGAVLFLALCMPQKASNVLRSGLVGFSIPLFKSTSWIMHSNASLSLAPQSEQLQLENLTLQAQIERVYNWLEQEQHLENITEKERFTEERLSAIRQNLLLQSQFLPAKVIFREPANWSSFVWIDIGKLENERMGFDLIAENSPVIAGSSLIGVVEYVGKNRSKVRLITDSALTPSVYGYRGKLQQRFLLEHMDPLLRILPLQKDLFKDPESYEMLMQLLTSAKEQLTEKNANTFVAKGFVEGLSQPLWRASSQKLKGIGFSQEQDSNFQVGDLLLTSGMDGVFPEGLRVGVISKTFPARRGEPTYAFEAQLAASKINELTSVQVIPPCR